MHGPTHVNIWLVEGDCDEGLVVGAMNLREPIGGEITGTASNIINRIRRALYNKARCSVYVSNDLQSINLFVKYAEAEKLLRLIYHASLIVINTLNDAGMSIRLVVHEDCDTRDPGICVRKLIDLVNDVEEVARSVRSICGFGAFEARSCDWAIVAKVEVRCGAQVVMSCS